MPPNTSPRGSSRVLNAMPPIAIPMLYQPNHAYGVLMFVNFVGSPKPPLAPSFVFTAPPHSIPQLHAACPVNFFVVFVPG